MQENIGNTKPLVSVCCITYNHAPFIRQSIEGMLMQKTTFPIEILIHDDCSTDGTTKIVEKYAAKYPDKIFPLYELENQYSKGVWVDGFNYRRARGKYIAYCEGDDYWTDPLKLQKQVDFMEHHDAYSVCFTRCKHQNVATGKSKDDDCAVLLVEGEDGVDLNLSIVFAHWCTQPLTMLFRMALFDFEWSTRYKYYRDMHEIYHLLKVGKGRLMNFDCGIRNIHEGGVASSKNVTQQCKTSLSIARELYRINKDVETKKFLEDTLQWVITEPEFVGRKFELILQHVFLSGNIKRLFKNLYNYGC